MESKNVYKNNFPEYLLCLALDIGEGMLKCGAEISRIENTVERICKAYGAVHVEVFAIISLINAAVRMPDGTYSTQVRRIHRTTKNFDQLERYNALSRQICSERPDLETVEQKIREIKTSVSYPAAVIFLCSALGAGAFAMFFGGDLKDAVVAALLGVVIALLNRYLPQRMNSMARIFVCTFAAAILSGLLVRLGVGHSDDMVMIGVIMLLIPGVAFGTAMNDLLCGELLAGVLKTVQCCLEAFMIALGYMMAFYMLGGGI